MSCFACAAKAQTPAGAVYACGYNGAGQLGNNSTDDSPVFVPVTGLSSGVTAIAAGGNHSLAIQNGAVYAWGYNEKGQLGNNSTTDSSVPVAVSGLTGGVTGVAGGDEHSLAIQNGAAYSWGWNANGQLGNGSTTDSSVPVAVSGLTGGVTAVAGGVKHSLAIQFGAAYAWGYGAQGQLGDNSTADSSVPVAVSGLSSGVTAVAASYYFSLAVQNGAAYSWGDGREGELGNNSTAGSPVPVAVTGLSSGVTAIAAGFEHGLAVQNGTVYAWGYNNAGQLGNGTTANSLTPVALGLSNITAVAASNLSSFALASDGSLWVWGDNSYGELGLGADAAAFYTTPQHLLPPSGYLYSALDADAYSGHVVALLAAAVPVITSAASASGQAGQPFAYQIAASNSPTNYNATGLPTGLNVDTAGGLISGTPATAGSFTIALSAANAGGTGTGTLTINILPAPPAITSGSPPNGQVGVAYSFQVAATNSPSSFTGAGLPSGLTLDATSGLISGTPLQPGTFNATITATNAGGSGTGMYSVTILPAVPVITSAASASGIAGQPFSYQIAASNSPASYNATGLPGGLNLDPTSGLISGTPTHAGTSNVALTATNAGGAGTATLTLTFSATQSQTPTITSSAAASATVGVPFSFAVTASNSPSSFGAVGLPPGLSIDASSGLISGTPTQAGASAQPVTYTVGISATNAFGTGTGDFTVTVSIPAADITGINILSPPTEVSIVQGETIALEGTVDALPGALASVDYGVYDATNTNLVSALGTFPTAMQGVNWAPTTLGDFTLRFTAIDKAGNAFPASIPIHVISSPTGPPVSTLLSGLDGKTFAAGSTLPLLGQATDANGNPISNATFYVNGNQVVPAGGSSAGAGPGKLQPKDAAAGIFAQASYQLTAIGDALLTLIGTDKNGVTGISAAATLHITAAASGAVPACAITSPATGAQVALGASVSVSANAAESSGPIAQVEFFVNNASAGKVTAAPYTQSIQVPMAGQFALTAIATDANGLSQASAPVIVNVAQQAVTIAVTGDGEAVAGGKKGKVTVTRTGDTSAPLLVRFKIAGAVAEGVDYEVRSNRKVTIPAGESQAQIKLTALNNPNAASARVAKVKLLPSLTGAYTRGAEVTAKIKLIDD